VLEDGTVLDPEPFGRFENPQREWNLPPWAVLSFVARMVLGCPKTWEYSLTLKTPDFLRARSEEILNENDPINNFFQTGLMCDPHEFIEFTQLFAHFQEWWNVAHKYERAPKQSDFKRQVEQYNGGKKMEKDESGGFILRGYAIRCF